MFYNTCCINLRENSIAIHTHSYRLQPVSCLLRLVLCTVTDNDVKGVTLNKIDIDGKRHKVQQQYILYSVLCTGRCPSLLTTEDWILLCVLKCYLNLMICLDLIDATVFVVVWILSSDLK